MRLNRPLYEENSHYVPLSEFRKNVTHAARMLYPHCNKDVEAYFERLRLVEKQNLIISEENLLGDAKDIYGSSRLYPNLERRARRMSDLFSGFDDLTI